MTNNIEKLDNRLIAYLDVLGFSQRIANEKPENLVVKYSEFITTANNKIFNSNQGVDEIDPQTNFAKTKFVFDSIILVSHPINNDRNISRFIFGLMLLMETGFAEHLPLRGAITLGDFVEDTLNGIFISDKFKHLVESEQKIDFSGCCVLDDAAEIILCALNGSALEPADNKKHHVLINYHVPIKDEGSRTLRKPMWCLNWYYLFDKRILDSSIDYLIDNKKKHTVEFVEFISNMAGQEKQKLSGSASPVFFRFMPSTTQCRLVFTDEHENPVNPPLGTQLAFDAEL